MVVFNLEKRLSQIKIKLSTNNIVIRKSLRNAIKPVKKEKEKEMLLRLNSYTLSKCKRGICLILNFALQNWLNVFLLLLF